jgi:hypothetical protein
MAESSAYHDHKVGTRNTTAIQHPPPLDLSLMTGITLTQLAIIAATSIGLTIIVFLVLVWRDRDRPPEDRGW